MHAGGLTLAAVVLGSLPAGWASAVYAARYGAGPRLRAVLVASAALLALIVLRQVPPGFAPWGWMLSWILLTLAAIDLVALRLPDVLTVPLAGLGLLEGWATGADGAGRALGLIVGLAAFGLLAAVYQRARGRSGLGGGDVKLLGAAGAWVGLAALPALVLGACAVAGLALGTRVLVQGRSTLARPFPFGMALACATWLVWVAQSGGMFVA